jgi:DNA (cytosine-5)-methyltransferase 1
LTVEFWFKKNDTENHLNSSHFFTPRAGLERFKVIDEGDDLKKSYKRLHRWRYSPTAAYGNNEVHLHPYKERRISVAEALSLQSLPKEFEIPENVTLTDMFKTIGNGVPFLAAQGLANSILDFIYNNEIKDLKISYAETYSQ